MVDKPATPLGDRSQSRVAHRPRAGVRSWLLAWRDVLTVTAAAALLAVLSLHEIGRYSFWQDEIASVVYSSAPLNELLMIVGRDRQVADVPFMAVYNVLLHFWLRIADSEAEIRLLSVLAGGATTIPVYFVARRLGGWRAGAFAAFTFAAMPFVVEWSRNARGYSLAMLVAAALTHLALRALERPTVRRFAAYGVVGAVGMYVHSFVALVIAVHIGYALWSGARPTRGPLLAAAVPLGVAAAPLPYLALVYGSGYAWIPWPSVDYVFVTLVLMAGSIPLLLAMVSFGWIAASRVRNNPRLGLVVASVLVPLVLTLAVSIVRPLLHSRYLIVILPSVAILAGIGLAAIRPRASRVAAVVAFAALLAFAVPRAHADHRQQDWRGVANWIAMAARPGDHVISTNQKPLLYYLERTGDETPLRRTGFRAIERAEDPPGQVWLVMLSETADAERDAVERLGKSGYRTTELRDFGARLTVVRLNLAE